MRYMARSGVVEALMRLSRGTRMPQIQAAIFGSYFVFVMFTAWTFASGLTTPWYGSEISRWAYSAYFVASAVFLAGLGILAFQVQAHFGRRIRELNRELGSFYWDWAPDATSEETVVSSSSDSDDHDLDEMLVTVGESQTEEIQDVLLQSSIEAAEEDAPVEIALVTVAQPALVRRREKLKRRAAYFTTFLMGPMVAAVGILGISAAMLPGTEVMLQNFPRLNTTLILGFAYVWAGLAVYFAAAIFSVVTSLAGRRRRGR